MSNSSNSSHGSHGSNSSSEKNITRYSARQFRTGAQGSHQAAHRVKPIFSPSPLQCQLIDSTADPDPLKCFTGSCSNIWPVRFRSGYKFHDDFVGLEPWVVFLEAENYTSIPESRLRYLKVSTTTAETIKHPGVDDFASLCQY